MLDDTLLNLLICPACGDGASLLANKDADLLVCPKCRRGYPVREGIPVMLLDEAVILDASDADANASKSTPPTA